MKIKALLIGLCFVSLLGSTYSAKAEFVKCGTFAIECDNGGGTNYVACGTYDSLTKEIREVRDLIC